MTFLIRLAAMMLIVSGAILTLALLIGTILPAQPMLAFYSQLGDKGAIYLLDASRLLTVSTYQTPYSIQSMAWSPDGQQIAFVTYEDNFYYLNRVDANGRNARRITQQTASTNVPVWSPDGQLIAFDAQTVTGTKLFMVEADGENLREIIDSSVSGNLVWSPNGERVALAAWTNDNPPLNILVLDVETCIYASNLCQPKQLTNGSANTDSRLPSWSPDGEQITFLSNRNGQWNIYLEDVECNPCDARPLTDIQVDGSTVLNWSPDGRWLAFTVLPIDAPTRLYVLDTACDTFNCTYFVSDKERGAHRPQWSPDGRWLAYYITQAGGTRIVLLDTACLPEDCKGRELPVSPSNVGSWYPIWQP